MKAFIVFSALFACALAYPSIKITNGVDAERDQFPYQISMQWGLLGIWQHICGGSLIAPNVVLTAGHCITETPGLGNFRVKGGLLLLNENVGSVQTIDVARSVVHPSYQGGVNPHDVAVLILANSFVLGESVQTIALPAAGAEFTGDTILSGWGSISTTSTPNMPNHLQTVTIPLLSHTECADAFTALMGTSDPLNQAANVCTGPLTGGISACSGDSGGPLAKDGQVIGIVSWGITPCGTTGAPSVYTKVSNYVDFINSHL